MTENEELCPKCKEGQLMPSGDVSVSGEGKEPFRESSSTRELICDKCGQRMVRVGINEYMDITDSVSSTVSKGNNKENL